MGGAQTQYKFNGLYRLPWWGLEASSVFQNLPGIPMDATMAVTNAMAAPRPLSLGSATIALFPPNTLLDKRLTLVDFRLTKVFRLGGTRLTGRLDIYNLFNDNTVTKLNTTYGPNWLSPLTILSPRLFKFGAGFEF